MKYSKSKIVFSVFFIALLALTGMPSVAALGTVSEDFTTTTYEDPATTAEGWGTGSVSNPREYTITQLDFQTTASDGGVWSLDTQGRKVYLSLYKTGTGTNALRVYNISDPSNIQFMDGQHPATELTATVVDGDICAVGSEHSTFFIYNVSDPTNIPSSIWNHDFGSGMISDIEIDGHHMYVTIHQHSGMEEFNIYDIENPASPIRCDDTGWAEMYGLDVQEDISYMATGIYGLNMLGISDPYDIDTDLCWVNTPGVSYDCLAYGDICYVADGASGVQVVDCSTPAYSTIIGSYDTPNNATRLALQGNTLFVGDGSSVQILDVSNPATPVYVDAITLADVRDIGLAGGVLVIGTDAGLYTYSVGSMVTDFVLVDSYSAYDAYDVAYQGNIAYVAAGADGLVVLDVSNPANPILLDQTSYGTTPFYTTVDVDGDTAYITNRGNAGSGLTSFNVTDPTNVAQLGSNYFSDPYDLAVSGNTLFLADGTLGVYLMNITDPNAMVTIDSSGTMDNATAVAVQGHFAYFAGNGSTFGNYGTFAYNLNDLSSILLANFIGHINPEDIVVAGDFAAVANREYGVNFVDISDPWDIDNMGFMSYPSADLTSVEIFGNYIFAGDRGVGIHLIDANNPNQLIELSNYTTGNPDVRSLTVGGDYLYAACGNRLLIFRIFRSAGDTYQNPCKAQSKSLYTSPTLIVEANLTATASTPSGTSIDWFLSADGGASWESVTPGVAHTFTVAGIDLRWLANITNNNDDRTASISSVSIDYVELPPPNLLPLIIAVIAVIIIILVILLLYFFWYKKQK